MIGEFGTKKQQRCERTILLQLCNAVGISTGVGRSCLGTTLNMQSPIFLPEGIDLVVYSLWLIGVKTTGRQMVTAPPRGQTRR